MLPVPTRPIHKHIDGVQFEFDFALLPSMKLMYRHAFEVETVHAIRHFLPEGGSFVDVGANVGFLSAIAMSRVGPGGKIFSFEPAPRYFDRLQRLAQLNPAYDIVVENVALADSKARRDLWLAGPQISGARNTLVGGLGSRDEFPFSISVATIRLDDYLLERNARSVSLIKIDVEGFELAVLKGLERYLRSAASKPPIICEILPEAYPLLGAHVTDLWSYMSEFDYRVVDLVDHERALRPDDLDPLAATNVLLLPAGLAGGQHHV